MDDRRCAPDVLPFGPNRRVYCVIVDVGEHTGLISKPSANAPSLARSIESSLRNYRRREFYYLDWERGIDLKQQRRLSRKIPAATIEEIDARVPGTVSDQRSCRGRAVSLEEGPCLDLARDGARRVGRAGTSG